MIMSFGHDRTERKVVGREAESDRGREAEGCCKGVVASEIKLAVRENIYDRYRTIILTNQDGHL
jgi:hypothetical protein